LVRQWEREIQTKINRSHRLSTFLYHSGKKASWETLRSFDIVLTTYGTLGAEYKRQEEWRRKCDENPNLDRNIAKNKFVFLGEDSLWYRIILDEAQCIKNKNTKAALAACHLRALTRFCLTGTPMMNGVHELFSLIRFLRIRPYNDHHKFISDFGCLSKSGGSRGSIHPEMEANAMKKLQAVLKAMLLRRTKTSKIDGKPILTLPEKTEEIVHAIFNEDEQAYYTALETKTLIQFNKYVKAGTIGKNYSNILVLLLRLRQAACHPHLIMDFEEAPPEASVEDMETWAKTLLPEVIRRIMEATVPFECPVCYDPIPNPRIVIPCGHDTCSECLVKIAGNVQQEAIAEGNEAGDAKCPTCRGRVDMKKIIDYETFKKVHMGQKDDLAAGDDETQSEDDGDSIYDSSDTESSATESEDGSDEDIRNFVVPDDYMSSAEESADEDDEEKADNKSKVKETVDFENLNSYNPNIEGVRVGDEVKDEDDDDDEFVEIKDIKPAVKPLKRPIEGPSHSGEKGTKKHKSKRRAKSKGKAKAKEKSKEPKVKHTSMAMLKKEATRSKEGHRRYMRYLKKNWVSSAKVDKCLEILRDTEPDIKTIVFSQFTTLLDLLEIPIRKEGWGFMRYDGSMSADARHHSVVKFTDDPRCKIMLVSLKAGNAGLNLVAASQVIILDPFW
jgi:SNF2 family DNA or RNA helicase